MFNPPGTVLMLEPSQIPQEVMVTPAEPITEVQDNVGEEQQNEQLQNRVIVNRRASVQLGAVQQQPQQQQNTSTAEGQQQQQNPKQKKLTVRPSYSTLRTNIIRMTPESMKCKLYCKGTKCIYCNSENWTESQQAIRGLYSHWINDGILAMARPTIRTFEEFELIKQFKDQQVRTVLNLQCVKEHDFCGPPLIERTGFTYNPELLMVEKLYYFNFAVPDFGTVSLKSILDICKVIWFSLKYGRIAIHCHAGLGRTGTMIACFLIWSNGMSSANAIEAVRSARPNSIQSMDQINVVEEFELHVQKHGTALPSVFFANNGPTLRQLMLNQREFLPSDEARRYAHIPKVLYMLCDRLLRNIFGKNGFKYMPPNGHHARSCTFGNIFVNWRNAFTPNGKLQVRQMVTAFARITAFPYEKDQSLIARFQQISLVNAEAQIDTLEALQLVTVLNAFLESIRRPYCSRRSLIDALSHFSPDNPTVLPPPDDQEEENFRRLNEEVELVKMLMNPVATNSENTSKTEPMPTNECQSPKLKNDQKTIDEQKQQKINDNSTQNGDDITVDENGIKMEKEKNENETVQQKEAAQQQQQSGQATSTAEEEIVYEQQCSAEVNDDDDGPAQIDATNCAKNYGGISLEHFEEQNGDDGCANAIDGTNCELMGKENVINNSSSTPNHYQQNENEIVDPLTVVDDDQFVATTFDEHDSHTNKLANLNADWQCIVFYVCNVLSFLTGENYDTMVDLLTFWFVGDNNRDVKQAVYCHMRDLFARNMRQQEQQAAEWRRKMGIP